MIFGAIAKLFMGSLLPTDPDKQLIFTPSFDDALGRIHEAKGKVKLDK